MHRQSSRSTSNMDAIDCIVNENDLALEDEILKREHDQRSKSRRDQPSKRSNETSVHRSTRYSPSSVTRKRHPSPQPISSSSSRSHHHYYPSQRYHRVSSPSPSPPPPPLSQSSSRHHRSSRPVVPVKRPHSQSGSPHERRPPIHRSRPELPTERTIGDVLTSIPSAEEQKISKKIPPKQETGDLSLVSEDESTKTYDSRSNGTATNELSSITTNNKLHSTPSLPILHPNSNESLLEMSNIPQDCELSLFAKSMLSTTNTSSILSPGINPTNDFMQTIDLISKYKMMQTIPNTNPQIEVWSKEILIIIQKQIELQKIELDYREREIKLRDRELAEREKRFHERSGETISMTSVNSDPLIVTKSTIIEENTRPKSEIIIDQDTKNVTQEESVAKTIPPIVDTLKVKLSNKNGSEQSSVTRKSSGKSRFSQIIVDPSIFPSQQKSVVDLYSDDLDDNQSSLSSINTTNSLKKATIPKILAPTDQLTRSTVGTDLKVTSSNSFRKVEIQSGNIDKTTSKGSSHDLRLTLSKNRPKQPNNDDHDTNDNQLINDDDEQIVKSKSNNENKHQSYDYQQQRSITSTSIETIIDDTNDKRDDRRHQQQQQQRINISRQPQQYPSSSNNNSSERTYTHGSTSQQQSKYGSNQKRYGTDDLRSRLFEQKNPKSSRTTHKNNY